MAKKVDKIKVETLVRFRDKTDGKIYEVGDVFAVTKERFAEILKVGNFVKEYTDKTAN